VHRQHDPRVLGEREQFVEERLEVVPQLPAGDAGLEVGPERWPPGNARRGELGDVEGGDLGAAALGRIDARAETPLATVLTRTSPKPGSSRSWSSSCIGWRGFTRTGAVINMSAPPTNRNEIFSYAEPTLTYAN
jgi:hypothetical protein